MTSQTDIQSFSSPHCNYEVFLSFRGKDTRRNFTDQLYAALVRKGIFTFRDDEELKKGKPISPELLKAIEESAFAIVVLSENYANSTWCLNELAKVVECMKHKGQRVLPVFYNVEASDVRKQRKSFGEAFSKHEMNFKDDIEKVQKWRDALTQVADLSGWDVQGRSEVEVIDIIVDTIFTQLNDTVSSVSTDLVGMESRLKEMLWHLDIGLTDQVRVIGILGMGGIGKTTLAEQVLDHERTLSSFDGGHIFLANVRDVTEQQGPVRGLIHLQNQLLLSAVGTNANIQNTNSGLNIMRKRLCKKKVLLILDDVNRLDQLEALCGSRMSRTRSPIFGPGSRIIITTRDEQLLSTFGVDAIYQVKALTDVESFQLFSWKSFNQEQVVGDDFLKLSKNFLEYSKGLPLAIKVLGSSLYGASINEWSSALATLKEYPNSGIIDVLKVSFDALQIPTKEVFLDIACFFKGENKDRVTRILESGCGFLPDYHIKVLIDKSLITLFVGRLCMHDMIQELGWEIVRGEQRKELGKRSRLWLAKDIIHVLEYNEGTEKVEGVFLSLPEQVPAQEVQLKVNPFSKLRKLRFLKISNVQFCGDIDYLSNELQLLEWHACSLNYLPAEFQSDKLVELIMCSSHIKQLWVGDKSWSMLKFINLSDSKNLIKTPNFTKVPNLKTLVLQGCTSLVEVDPSLGFLKNLITLNMRNCESVESLPTFIGLKSLETLILSSCSRFKKFPEIEGNMESLLELDLDGTSIEDLPLSIKNLSGLISLDLGHCKKLLHLPSTIEYLKSLRRFILTGCLNLSNIPEGLKRLECLEKLDISGTAIKDTTSIAALNNIKSLSIQGCALNVLFPSSFSSGYRSLMNLNLSDCNLTDGSLPTDIGTLFSLRTLDLSWNDFVNLPESISQLSKLEILGLRNCRKLQYLPKPIPLSVRQVHAQDCILLKDFPDQLYVWTSAVAGITTVNTLISSPSTAKVLMFSSYLGPGMSTLTVTYVRQGKQCTIQIPQPVEVLLKNLELFDFRSYGIASTLRPLDDEIPEWFRTTHAPEYEIPEWFSNAHELGTVIPVPPNLKDNKKWMGLAAICLLNRDTGASRADLDSEAFNCLCQCTLVLNDFRVAGQPLFWNTTDRHNLLCLFYIPGAQIPAMLYKSIFVGAIFQTNQASMSVTKCGIRLVDEDNIAGFIQTCRLYTDDRYRQHQVTDSLPIEHSHVTEVDHKAPAEVDDGLRGENIISISEEESIIQLWNNQHQTIAQVGHTTVPEVDDILTSREDIIPTSEEGSTIQLRNIVSILPRHLSRLNHKLQCYTFSLSGSPAWFNPQVGDSASIQLPPNLHKNKRWMGFALCVSVAVDQHRLKRGYGYSFSCQIYSGNLKDEPVIFRSLNISDEHQLWLIYIPRTQFREELISSSSTSSQMIHSLFRTIDDGVKLRFSGFRILYQQNLLDFVQTISSCILQYYSLCDISVLKDFDRRVIEEWLDLIRWQTPKEVANAGAITRRIAARPDLLRYRDWSEEEFWWLCPGFEIPDWLKHLNNGSPQVKLPKNLHDNGDWVGMVVYSYFSIIEHPTLLLNIPDSEFFRMIVFELSTDVPTVRKYFEVPMSRTMWLHSSGFTWCMHIPRALFDGSWNQCSEVMVRFGSNPLGVLAVNTCAVGLVFKKDVEVLVQLTTRFTASRSGNWAGRGGFADLNGSAR